MGHGYTIYTSKISMNNYTLLNKTKMMIIPVMLSFRSTRSKNTADGNQNSSTIVL